MPRPDELQIKGQMDIFECIRVAEEGLDGKPPVVVQEPERRDVEVKPGGRKAA